MGKLTVSGHVQYNVIHYQRVTTMSNFLIEACLGNSKDVLFNGGCYHIFLVIRWFRLPCAIFNSYVSHNQGHFPLNHHFPMVKPPFFNGSWWLNPFHRWHPPNILGGSAAHPRPRDRAEVAPRAARRVPGVAASDHCYPSIHQSIHPSNSTYIYIYF